MLQKYSRYRILQEFLDFPTKRFMLRELSRRTGITQPTMKNHLKALTEEGLITREEQGLYPTYRAERDNQKFKLYRRMDITLRLDGAVQHIYDSCMPDAIVLFGSASKGEDIEDSDIIDVYPTLLYMYGIDVSKEVDGRILKSLFSTQPTHRKKKLSTPGLSNDEKEKIQKLVDTIKL